MADPNIAFADAMAVDPAAAPRIVTGTLGKVHYSRGGFGIFELAGDASGHVYKGELPSASPFIEYTLELGGGEGAAATHTIRAAKRLKVTPKTLAAEIGARDKLIDEGSVTEQDDIKRLASSLKPLGPATRELKSLVTLPKLNQHTRRRVEQHLANHFRCDAYWSLVGRIDAAVLDALSDARLVALLDMVTRRVEAVCLGTAAVQGRIVVSAQAPVAPPAALRLLAATPGVAPERAAAVVLAAEWLRDAERYGDTLMFTSDELAPVDREDCGDDVEALRDADARCILRDHLVSVGRGYSHSCVLRSEREVARLLIASELDVVTAARWATHTALAELVADEADAAGGTSNLLVLMAGSVADATALAAAADTPVQTLAWGGCGRCDAKTLMLVWSDRTDVCDLARIVAWLGRNARQLRRVVLVGDPRLDPPRNTFGALMADAARFSKPRALRAPVTWRDEASDAVARLAEGQPLRGALASFDQCTWRAASALVETLVDLTTADATSLQRTAIFAASRVETETANAAAAAAHVAEAGVQGAGARDLFVGERVQLADGRVGVVRSATVNGAARRSFAVPSRAHVRVELDGAVTGLDVASIGVMRRATATHAADGPPRGSPVDTAIALVGATWTPSYVQAVLASGAERIFWLGADEAVLRRPAYRSTNLRALLVRVVAPVEAEPNRLFHRPAAAAAEPVEPVEPVEPAVME